MGFSGKYIKEATGGWLPLATTVRLVSVIKAEKAKAKAIINIILANRNFVSLLSLDTKK